MSFTYELDKLCLDNKFNVSYVLSVGGGKYTREDVVSRIEYLMANKNKVQELLNIPLVEQKSEQWYEMRRNLITASDFAQALGQGKFGSQADIFKKKVRPEDESAASFSNPFFQMWQWNAIRLPLLTAGDKLFIKLLTLLKAGMEKSQVQEKMQQVIFFNMN